MKPLFAAIIASAALSGCAASGQPAAAGDAGADKLAAYLKGYQPVGSSECLTPRRAQSSKTFDGSIVFHDATRSHLYVSPIPDGCTSGQGDTIAVTRSFTGQLCRGDPVNFISRPDGFPVGSCALGRFTEYRRAPRPQ